MKRDRTPQEKKVLSYAKDGRNTLAESRAKSRTAIAKRKASATRALRRAETVATSQASTSVEEREVVVSRNGRRSWQKVPDAPLAEFVGRTLNRRTTGGMNEEDKKSALLEQGKRFARPRSVGYKGPLQG